MASRHFYCAPSAQRTPRRAMTPPSHRCCPARASWSIAKAISSTETSTSGSRPSPVSRRYRTSVVHWSMAYAGGVLAGASDTQTRQLYAFLREALKRGTAEAAFRGPARHETFGYEYVNEWRGSVDEFSGAELIRRDGAVVYQLTYAGGRVR